MSEQEKPKGYMAELDAWTDQAIIGLLEEEGIILGMGTNEEIKHSIRNKVLESYKNGIRAGLAKAADRRPAEKEQQRVQAKTR